LDDPCSFTGKIRANAPATSFRPSLTQLLYVCVAVPGLSVRRRSCELLRRIFNLTGLIHSFIECDSAELRSLAMAKEEVLVNQQEILGNQKAILENQAKLNKIVANQATIIANQESILQNQSKLDRAIAHQATIVANQETIQANQEEILQNQHAILSNQTKILAS
jgi:hypothetical protein